MPVEEYLSGKRKHAAQQRKHGHSRITSSLTYDEQIAMIEYGVSTETEWLDLPRDERARKIATIMARSFVEAVHRYDATRKTGK